MWVAQPVVANWVYYKTPTSRETWQTRSLRQEVCCAYSDVILFLWCHGFLKWRLQFLTAVLEGNVFDVMEGYTCKVSPQSLWDTAIEVLHAKPGGNSVRAQPMHKHSLNPTHGPFCSFFYVPPNAPLSSAKSSLYVFEDNEPVFKMINKGKKSNNMKRLMATQSGLELLTGLIFGCLRSQSSTSTPRRCSDERDTLERQLNTIVTLVQLDDT